MGKVCICCGIEKELIDFYKHSQMADGHLNKCKACCIEYEKARRIYDPVAVCTIEKRKARPNATNRCRSWRANNPEKYRAQNKLNNAIRDHKISRPIICDICGGGGVIHAHHTDYSRPLDVIWLCARCHAQIQ